MTTGEIFIIGIFIGIVLFILNFMIISAKKINDDDYFFPTVLYKKTNMNIFGCIVCSILLFAINYLYCSIYCILRFIYWLFTVGKKERKE